MKAFFCFCLLLLILGFTSCSNNAGTSEGGNEGEIKSSVATLSYNVSGTYPHDTSSFTQGLVFYNGNLLEGTGLNGKSKLMQVDLSSGKEIKKVALDSSLFGEGITVLNDTIYQLTWQNKVVLVYTAKDFKKIKELPINTEGWGITNDGKSLIVSDGSSNLYFYEPATFKLLKTQSVTEDGTPVVNINELEYINGFVYANQWQYNDIVKIDPNSGQVIAKLDLSEVINRVKTRDPQADFLNGIAYNPETKKIYITGKLWPELYEVQFLH
jgi:glutamine cyclotransferase